VVRKIYLFAFLVFYLNFSGKLEHFELAQRLVRRHAAVFSQPYHPVRSRLRSTQKSRTGRSASSFAFGLWHGTGDVSEHGFEPTFITTTGPLDNDIVLRPFDKCPLYREMKKAPSTKKHYEDYMRKITPGIAKRISRILGLKIKADLIQPIWRVCKAELSTYNESDFCSLFEEDEVLGLELGDDIEAYWEKGPGNAINYEMMCPLIQDILHSITQSIEERDHRHLDLRFAHAETIIPLITILVYFSIFYLFIIYFVM
jgi:multiple inositol-polyphosphate phosphatase / 2,3-bisphosphoglycerate 3-phosphatase